MLSRKTWLVILPIAVIVLAGVIIINNRRYGTSTVDRYIRDLRPDEFVETQRNAVAALGQLGPAAKAALPALKEMVGAKDELLATRAAWSLWQVAGPEAGLPLLLDYLQDPDREVRLRMVQTLKSIGPPAEGAVPPLKELLEDSDPSLRLEAAEALWHIMRVAEPEVTTALAKLVKHGNPQIRVKTAKLLAEMGSSAQDAVSALKEMMAEPDGSISLPAAQALWRIFGDVDLVLPIAILGVKGPGCGTSKQAARLLINMGPAAKPAIPALKAAFAETTCPSRQELIEALRVLEG